MAERVLDKAQLMVYRDWASDEEGEVSQRKLIRLIVSHVDGLEAELTSVTAEIARLRELLKPFAVTLTLIEADYPSDVMRPFALMSTGIRLGLSIGDFRRAAAALKPKEGV